MIAPLTLFPPAAGASDQYLAVSDGTEIGSSGKATDGASNQIDLVIPDTTTAVVTANGVGAMYGAVIKSLGSTLTSNYSATLEWVAGLNSSYVCVGILRATSAPTTMDDLEADSTFVQITRHASGNVSCFLKEEAQALASVATTSDNKSGSVRIQYSVGVSDAILRRAIYQHIADTNADNVDSTSIAAASGDWYLWIAWGTGATISGGDKTISVKLRAGFLQ